MKAAKLFGGIFLIAGIAVFLLVSCGMVSSVNSPKTHQEKYVLKFNHVLADSEPFHKGLLNWSQRVAARTGGKLEIQVYHSAQLGLEEDVIEQIRHSANLGQNTDAARLATYVPEIAVINAPYFLDNINDVMKLRDLPTFQKWRTELEDEYGIKILSFNWVQGMRQIVANKPIKNPEDLVGMRIRVPDNLRWQQGVRTAGVEPVALPFGEVYVGMEQKNIDGAGLVYWNITDSRLFEVAKFVNNTNHIYLINFEVISKEFFDSLPPEYQKILVEECDKAGLEASIEMEQGIEMQKKDLERHGMTIVSDVNLPAFRQASERAYQELNLICVRDEIYKEMGKR